MATLAGAGCLGTTPCKYHSIRFSFVVGMPIVAVLLGVSIDLELVAKIRILR